MNKNHGSSRSKFEAYQEDLKRRLSTERSGTLSASGSKHGHRSPRSRSSITLVRDFFRLMGDQRPTVLFALSTLTIATLLALVPPAATKGLVDYVLGGSPLPDRWVRLGLPTDRWSLLVWGVVVVVAIQWVKSLIHIWGRWHATRASRRIQLNISKQLFEHTSRLPLHRVYELKSGGVSSILRQDVKHASDLVFAMLYNPWRAVVQLIGSLCVLAWVDWRLLIGALMGLPLIYFTHRTWIGRIRPQHRDMRMQRKAVDAHATEAFSGVRVVRGFGRERRETGRFIRGSNLMVRMQLRIWWYTRVVDLAWSLFIPLATGMLLLYGGRQVLNGTLTAGDLMMFLVYMLMLLDPVAVLAQNAATLQNGLSALDRILDLFDEPREVTASLGTRVVSKQHTKGKITFDNVSFRYPGTERYALREINCEIQPGTTYALVGNSGAGKTTLCNLVARFYDPTHGKILLDDVDLRQFDVDSYRQLLGVVDQEVFLFDGTVAENIGYADRDASLERIVAAAEAAYADEFIRDLPNGYETMVGERGVKLSGGQRQRLSIARAILADPKILILDEATSNLDTYSERRIQMALESLTADRTTLVIAHRLTTITHADAIVVMHQGSILEIGSHRELVEAEGPYLEMIQRQTGAPANLADYASGD